MCTFYAVSRDSNTHSGGVRLFSTGEVYVILSVIGGLHGNNVSNFKCCLSFLRNATLPSLDY